MDQRDMDDEAFKLILSMLPDLRCLELQGEGEPFVHPRFFELAGAARSVFPDLFISTISNGNSLTPENGEELLKSGIDSVSFSIESVSEEMYRRIRGGDLSRYMKNLRDFMETRRRSGRRSPSAGLAVTILEESVQDIDDILILYSELGLDGGIIFQPLQRMEGYTHYYSRELLEQIPSSQTLFTLGLRLNSHPVMDTARRDMEERPHFYSRLMTAHDIRTKGCPWLVHALFIDVAGRALPCCKVKDADSYSMGIVGKTDSEDILRMRREYNRMLLSGEIPAFCRGCSTGERIINFKD